VAHQGDSVVTIDEDDDERGCHLTLRGRLDRTSAADVRLGLRRTIAAGASPLHVDLAEVVIGDATGIGVLVEALRCARRAGRPMWVVAADARTTRLMRRARLGGLLVGREDEVLAGAAG
jgi:anti-anti-sigma factor